MPISQTRKLLTIKYDHRGLLESQEDYNMRWLAASYFTVIWLQILGFPQPLVKLDNDLQSLGKHLVSVYSLL